MASDTNARIHEVADALPGPSGARQAIAFPITRDTAKFRTNILVSANAMIPASTWASASFRAAISATDGTFPVNVWRSRAGVESLRLTVRVSAMQTGSLLFRLPDDFARGDVALIEYTPALLVMSDGGQMFLAAPIMSVIDNTSGDPTTLFGTRVEFRP